MKKSLPLAVVGRSCRLPGASDVAAFWRLLVEGRCAVTSIGEDRWEHARYLHPRKGEPGKSYTFAAGVLDDIWGFDPAAFGISPREAEQMDPQQRLALQLVWEALEDAGIPPSSIAGSETGVFVGASALDYGNRVIFDAASADAYFATGNTLSIVSNRISYIYDLHGPSFTIDTACSSSLVAMNEAVAALRSGRIERALVVGVNILGSPFPFISFAQATMLSPQGLCRAFDAGADGYVRAEGGVAIVLERADLARAAHRPMRLMIAASGVNSDGRTVGMSLPSASAQVALLERVYGEAGVDLDRIAFIEAHGTGTRVGDPAEAAAVGGALRGRTGGPLPIGSVKSNVGHLEPASGLVGLLKVDLALENDLLPATLHVDAVNPDIPFEALNLVVATEARPLPRGGQARYAGVNSFGFGGTNAHVVAYDPTPEDRAGRSAPRVVEMVGAQPLMALSARTREALAALAGAYAKTLDGRDAAAARHVATSVAATRDLLPRRLVLESDDPSTWGATLASVAEGRETRGVALDQALGREAPVAFVYSGNGSQWAGMGRRLHAKNPAFRARLADIDARFEAIAGWSLKDALFADDLPTRLRRAEIAQPLLFAVQDAATAALAAVGVTPDVVLGHSVGEVAAALASGALSRDQAVAVVHSRSVHQEIAWKAGSMAAVLLPADEVKALIRDGGFANVEIAAVNSARSITVSGPTDEIRDLNKFARGRRVPVRVLDLDYPFHTGLVDGVREPLFADLGGLKPRATRTTFVSSVFGGPVDGTTLDAGYWWANVRRPVRFEDAVKAAVAEGARVFVEIGPRPVLQTYLTDGLAAIEVQGGVLSCDDHGPGDHDPIRRTLARVVAKGGRVDRDAVFGRLNGPAVRLPTYPWQNARFAVASTAESESLYHGHDLHPLIGARARADADEWSVHLDAATAPLLGDHKVSGRVVVPAAALAEMALAAGRAWLRTDIIELSDFEIPHALSLDPDTLIEVRTRISPESRTVEILSRPRLRADDWIVHAVGRVASAPTHAAEKPAPAPVAGETFTAAEIYARSETHGLGFGPAFRVVDHVDRPAPDRIVVSLAPAAARPGRRDVRYGLHPADFDACFHGLLTLFDAHGDRPDITYLPMRFGALRLFKPGATIAVADIAIRRFSARSIEATFTLLDAAGDVIATLTDARFRAVTLTRRTPLERLAYHVAPALVAASGDAEDAPLGSAAALAARAAALGLTNAADRADDDLLLEAFAVALAHDSLAALFGRTRKAAVADLVRQGQLAAGSVRLANRLLGILEERSHAALDGDVWTIAARTGLPGALDIVRTVLSDHPDRSSECVIATRAAALTPRVLREGPLASGLFAAATLAHAGGDAPLVAGGVAAVAALVADHVRHAPADRPIRILELAAGSGALTRRLAGLAAERRVTLTVTDPDATTAERLRFAFASLPGVTVTAFDPSSEGVDPGRFDLVVGALAWGSALGAPDAVRRLAACLADGGRLILSALESTPFLDVTFGLADGWYERSAADDFPVGGARAPADWTAELSDARLVDHKVAALGGARAPTSLILAAKRRRAAPAEPMAPAVGAPVVLVPESAGPLAIAIARAVEGAGRPVTVHAEARTPGANGRANGKSNGKSNGNGHHHPAEPADDRWGVALDLGLAAPAKANAPVASRTDIVATFDGVEARDAAATTERAGRLLSLARAAAAADARLWIVAPGALGGTFGDAGERADQAALAGFLRVVRNEYRGLDIRLLDVDARLTAEASGRAVAAEIAMLRADPELSLTPEGVVAPRLRPGLPPLAVEGLGLGERIAVLDTGREGGLDDVAWRAGVARAPGRSEVAIDVVSVGLNFRDVMWALGLLPEEALEDGFAGPGLGIECAGVVACVGDDVRGLAVGDRVVAFASGAFASRVVAPEIAVAKLPDGIGFDEGATIPVCFLTAYYALHHLAKIERGEWVLIHGGAGGVGLAALQIALWRGAKVIATAGSDEKRDLLRALGARHVLSSRSLEFVDEVKAITGGEGVDVVLNSLFGEAMERSLQTLKPFGRFLELGKRDYYANSRVGLRPFRRNISYFGIDADQLLVHRPDLGRKLFRDVLKLFAKGVLAPLPYRTFAATEVRDGFRLMQQSGHVGKIVIHPLDPAALAPASAQRFRPADGAHVLVGGLGGFGLATAAWLVAHGATRIALLGRTGAASDTAREGVARLTAMGATVLALACDAADEPALKAALARVRTELGPIGGAWHVAMVLDDALLINLDRARFHAVLSPKIDGAAALDRLTRDDPLGQFVVYSSATTVIGNPGQANYVAANAWLEALARRRRREGRPGLAVAWGALGDVGYLARAGEVREKIQRRLGHATLSGAEALEGLGTVLARAETSPETAAIAIAPIDWAAARRDLAFLASPMFAQVLASAEMGPQDSVEQIDLADLVRGKDAREAREVVAEILAGEVARILKLPAKEISAQRPLAELGMDSLMGLELRMSVERRFDIELPLVAIGDATTLTTIAQSIVSRIHDPETVADAGNVNADLMQRHVSDDVADDALAEFGEVVEARRAAMGRVTG